MIGRARPELDAWSRKQSTGEQLALADFREKLFQMLVAVEGTSNQEVPVQFVVWSSVRPSRWATDARNCIGCPSRSIKESVEQQGAKLMPRCGLRSGARGSR